MKTLQFTLTLLILLFVGSTQRAHACHGQTLSNTGAQQLDPNEQWIKVTGTSPANTWGCNAWLEVEVRCTMESFDISGGPFTLPYNSGASSYPFYQSPTISKANVAMAYPWVTIPFSQLCPGHTYQYRMREHHQNTVTGVGPWSATHYFTVPGTANITAAISAPSTYLCTGDCVELTGSGIGGCDQGYSYSWSHGLGTSKVVEVCPQTTTTYTLTVTELCSGLTDQETITIHVGPPAIPGTASISKTIACYNDPFTLNLIGSQGDIQWQYSSQGGPWFNYGSHTSPTVNLLASSSACFRAKVTGCGPGAGIVKYSNVVCIEVLNVPPVSIPLGDVCLNEPPFNLPGAGDPNITFAITGNPIPSPLSNGVFDPAIAGVGSFTIIQSVNYGGCITDNIITINVIDPTPPPMSFGPFCENDLPISLAAPLGGNWVSPAGFNGNFEPNLWVGTHKFTFCYDEGAPYCGKCVDVYITTVPTPNVQIQSESIVCMNAAHTQLIATPAGGTWSGPGVSASGVFNPGAVGPGLHMVTYTYSSPPCVVSVSTELEVIDTSPIQIPVGPLCWNSTMELLPGANDPFVSFSPLGGLNPAAISSNGVFNSSLAGTGNWEVQQSVNNQGCITHNIININVGPGYAYPLITQGPFCETDPGISFNAPNGGTWSGPNGFNGNFDPSQWVGTHTFTYCWPSAYPYCGFCQPVPVTTYAKPVVSISDTSVCEDGGLVTLSGSPAGGTWSGAGFIAPGVFDPSITGPGTFTQWYTVTNGECTTSESMELTVVEVPEPETIQLGPFCEDEGPFRVQHVIQGGGIFIITQFPNGLVLPPDTIANGVISLPTFYHGVGWELTQVITTPEGCEIVKIYQFDVIDCMCRIDPSMIVTQQGSCSEFNATLILNNANYPATSRFMWTISDNTLSQTLVDVPTTSPAPSHNFDFHALPTPLGGTQELCFHIWSEFIPVDSVVDSYCRICETIQICPPDEPASDNPYNVSSASGNDLNEVFELKPDGSKLENAITIKPNPSSGWFMIDGIAKNSEVTVFDMLGKQIVHTQIVSNSTSLNLSGQPNGIYLVKIVSNGNVQTEQIIKK